MSALHAGKTEKPARKSTNAKNAMRAHSSGFTMRPHAPWSGFYQKEVQSNACLTAVDCYGPPGVEGRLILKNCSLFRADGRVSSGMSIVVEQRLIHEIKPDDQVPILPGDWEVRCSGRLVTTALVDCHTRLVGGPLTPWVGDLLLRSFAQRCEQEWRLEAALTVGVVEAISAFSMARNLRQGVGMMVEHLHAPACVEAALAVQAKVARQLGVRLVNSHASNSMSATVPGGAQVEANARYAESIRGDELVRASMGIRGSFCADDDVLRLAGRAKERLAVGAHFGLAENDDDLAATWSKTQSRIVTRFERFGLLGGASVGAHARAVDRHETARLAQSRTLVALTPRASQTFEGHWSQGTDGILVNHNLIGLGSGGVGSLWEEFAASCSAVLGLARSGRIIDPDHSISSLLVGGPAELCTMLYGAPSGSVEVGALADLIVYDYVPAREEGNFTPHLLMRLSQMQVGWTIIDGRVVVREGELLGADFLELSQHAAAAIESVWRRVGLPGGSTVPP
jgi:5-methylthioadenosine/S-adenosylhomocysteine deaminase